MRQLCSVLCILFLLIFFFSCKKDNLLTSPDARLIITADTLKFDTVFTSTGSVTRQFKIVNDNDQPIRLSSVKLMGGNNSSFRININGNPSQAVENIEIENNDSIYVFVSVTVNPNSSTLPFILSDSVQVIYNGNTRYVQLQAYGQNARFLRNTVIAANTTWTNELPYVILGTLRVDTAITLTINKGVKIYHHADAAMIIDGTLKVNGTKNENVLFTGDRLDQPYSEFPAAWPGIYFRGSSINNELVFAHIKNAYQAVVSQLPSSNLNSKIKLQQCIIDNSYDAGILCINSSASVNNTLISNCGNNIRIDGGGIYEFYNITAASYSGRYLFHNSPVLKISNYYDAGGTLLINPLTANFVNSIFWGDEGSVSQEISISREGTTIFDVSFSNSIYKGTGDPANATFINSLRNTNPSFDSINIDNRYFDFRVTRNLQAPGIDKGINTPFSRDLDDLNRNAGLTDIGAYEKQ